MTSVQLRRRNVLSRDSRSAGLPASPARLHEPHGHAGQHRSADAFAGAVDGHHPPSESAPLLKCPATTSALPGLWVPKKVVDVAGESRHDRPSAASAGPAGRWRRPEERRLGFLEESAQVSGTLDRR